MPLSLVITLAREGWRFGKQALETGSMRPYAETDPGQLIPAEFKTEAEALQKVASLLEDAQSDPDATGRIIEYVNEVRKAKLEEAMRDDITRLIHTVDVHAESTDHALDELRAETSTQIENLERSTSCDRTAFLQRLAVVDRRSESMDAAIRENQAAVMRKMEAAEEVDNRRMDHLEENERTNHGAVVGRLDGLDQLLTRRFDIVDRRSRVRDMIVGGIVLFELARLVVDVLAK
jgi:hypothetical protein